MNNKKRFNIGDLVEFTFDNHSSLAGTFGIITEIDYQLNAFAVFSQIHLSEFWVYHFHIKKSK